MNHRNEEHEGPPHFWGSRYAVGLLVFGAIAVYFLLSEHRGHFFGALPFLLLLACPVMHVFMHHGHGGHSKGHADNNGGGKNSNLPAPAKPSKTEENP